MSGCGREEIRDRLKSTYHAEGSAQSLGQVTGIVHRFTREICVGEALVVPDGPDVYFGIVTEGYAFRLEHQADEIGYPHQIGVRYGAKPVERKSLPAILFDALKGRQSVFGLPPEPVWDVIENPGRYESAEPFVDPTTKARYIDALAAGRVPGINSPQFEAAVGKVLGLYYPNLVRQATTASPEGGDTDLKTELPGGIVIRVQVKCYQQAGGALGPSAIAQLRNSMDPGEHGLVVTTNQVSDEARQAADANPTRPVGIIDGKEFASLVFDSLEQLDEADLWALGLRWELQAR